MKNINIIVMGKTGAGKSTLINAILQEDLAPTGMGRAVTRKNEIYSKKMMLPISNNSDDSYEMVNCLLNMYDTVGLEIDSSITELTLNEIRMHIKKTKQKVNADDIHLVWFCVNNRNSRFEKYELKLIRKLSIEYEIPFIIVLTQCFSDEEGKLENQIRINLSEIPRCRVLAKEYATRGGKIQAYGINELIQRSLCDYKNLKKDIIERKLEEINWLWTEIDERKKERIEKIEEDANYIILRYASKAKKVGYIPGGCIPFVHGICIKLIIDLNNLVGVKYTDGFAKEIFSDVIVGLFATPFMVVPLLSTFMAESYIETMGQEYLKAMMNVIKLSSGKELENTQLVKRRLQEELIKLKI